MDRFTESEEVADVRAKLFDATKQWFYSPEDNLPYLWSDQYYVSGKNTPEESEGFFHLMVTLPTTENSEPSLFIFYPQKLMETPLVIFEYNPEPICLDNWEGGYAWGGKTIVDKMLSNPAMYLIFHNARTPKGTEGDEVALIQ